MSDQGSDAVVHTKGYPSIKGTEKYFSVDRVFEQEAKRHDSYLRTLLNEIAKIGAATNELYVKVYAKDIPDQMFQFNSKSPHNGNLQCVLKVVGITDIYGDAFRLELITEELQKFEHENIYVPATNRGPPSFGTDSKGHMFMSNVSHISKERKILLFRNRKGRSAEKESDQIALQFVFRFPRLDEVKGLNIVILTVGTWGDVQPSCILAGELMSPKYEHNVLIATHATFKDRVLKCQNEQGKPVQFEP